MAILLMGTTPKKAPEQISPELMEKVKQEIKLAFAPTGNVYDPKRGVFVDRFELWLKSQNL